MSPQKSAVTTPTRRTAPRRAAATKATSSFADQLASSSPIRPPDAEHSAGLSGSDNELSELTDDEPMDITPTKAPEVARESPERNPVRLPGDLSPLRSPTVKRTYARKDRAILPDVRTGTTMHTTASSSRLPLSPTSPLTPSPTPLSSPSRSARTKTPGRSTFFASPLSAIPTTPKRKRRANVDADAGLDEDDLSPTPASPSKRRNTAKSVSKELLQPSVNGKPASKAGPSKTGTKKDWSLSTLGHTVWVKLNDRNEVVYDNKSGSRIFWWPAKVTKTPHGTSVKVSLFNPPNPVVSALTEVRKPSVACIRSQYDAQGKERFDENSYSQNNATSVPASSSKGVDYDSRWRVAVSQMHDEEDKHHDFPDSFAAMLSQTSYNKDEDGPITNSEAEADVAPEPTPAKAAGRKGKAKAKPVTKSRKEIFREQWTPSPDNMLEIPGELVLSLERKRTTVYWPGTIIGFTPPADETKVGKYTVKMFDGMEVKATRGMFITSLEDDFATCKLGELKPLSAPSESDDPITSRESSPDPLLPAPSVVDFHKLSIRQQFAYTKPVLLSILNDEFPPAKELHDAFMSGGPRRVEVCRQLGAKGNLRNDEYEALSECAQHWALRGERRAKNDNDGTLNGDAEIAIEQYEPDVNDSNAVTMDSIATPQPIRPHPIEVVETPTLHTPTDGGNASAADDSPLRPPPSSSVATPTDTPCPPEEQAADGSQTDKDPLPSMRSPTNGASPVHSSESQNGVINQSSEKTSLGSRIHGCPAYERLSIAERIDYCTSILLQEAVHQILLWRTGEREVTQRLPDEEEVRLRNIGIEKATEVNAWTTVLQLREMKRKQLGLQSETKAPSARRSHSPETVTRARTRRRKA